jgi:hypothetical protein
LELPHLPPLGGQDCNRLLLPTLWLLVALVVVVMLAAAAVRVAIKQAQHL